MRFGIRMKLLIFAVLVWAVIFGVYSVYIYGERIEQTRRMALATASLLSRKIAADRQFYTSTIVKRALEAGLLVTASYHDNDKAIPLPATFTKEVSGSLGNDGSLHMEIVSLQPINPENGPKDPFQKEALESFSKGSDMSFYRFEKFKGKESVRYMIPDVATSQICVDCHNRYPASPKRDYKIGDVAGGLEVVVPIESEMAAAMADVWRSIVYGFFVVLTMGLVGFAFIRKVVTSPISSLVDSTRRLSQGDLTAEAEVKSDDEIGDLGKEANEVVRGLRDMIEGIRSTSDNAFEISARVKDMRRHALDSSGRQNAALDSIASSMEGINASIAEIARHTGALAGSMEKGSASVVELGASINGVADNMESLFALIDDASRSTREISASLKESSDEMKGLSASVSQVSSSMTRMNEQMKESGFNAGESAGAAEAVIRDARLGMETVNATIDGITRAKDVTRESTGIINTLHERIKEIGRILDVIMEVAEETNLLALNAAIIAAQSGEHGRSFSVVSNEIKDLAERTATSAKEVSEIIDAVEIESSRAVKSMEKGVQSVEEGVRLSMEAGEGLRKIVESAQKSSAGAKEIKRASIEQLKEGRAAAEAIGELTHISRRALDAAEEQARGSELVSRAAERVSDIAGKVRGAVRLQAGSDSQIASTFEDVNRMVIFVNNIISEQARNTEKVLEAIDAVRKISDDNMEKAMEADKAVEKISELNRQMVEGVKRFKLRK